MTVPVLDDTATQSIVNEESAAMARMLATEFDRFQTSDRALYPVESRAVIERAIEDIHASINTGVYRAGFAESQTAYERAVSDLFDALERWDRRLATSRFAVGDQLTLADVFLFPTLYRFDAVYYTQFKCNRRLLVDFDNLWDYTRDVYQTAGVAETCDPTHVKDHYYRSHEAINPTGFVPVGPLAPPCSCAARQCVPCSRAARQRVPCGFDCQPRHPI